MNAVGRCSKGVAVAVALLVGTVASADWQVSSTDQRLLKLLDPTTVPNRFARAGIEPGATVKMGPRCTLIFNAGHTLLADDMTLRLPRGTLEMFIDYDTVLYRNSGKSSARGGNDNDLAPAIQFHRLVPRGSDEIVDRTEDEVVVGEEEVKGDWSPDSVYDDDRQDVTGTEVTETVRSVGHSRVSYLVRAGYSMMEYAGETELVLPPSSPLGNEVTSLDPNARVLDAADRYSSYWIDYSDDVRTTLRSNPGDVSLRVYFPGFIKDAETMMNPEHPHYVNWSLDMGMMEGDANEAFSKLEACAARHSIDYQHAKSWVPTAVD